MGKTSFGHEKEQFLKKLDKSRKGSIDAGIRKLVNAVNRKADYYTTSSCSGRTMLIRVPEKGRKWDSEWLFSSHGKIRPGELKEALAELPDDTVWFKKEGMILHVCCRDIGSASWLADSAVKAGFRRSGILAKKKIIVEVNDTEKIDAPVAFQGKLIADDNYLSVLALLANRKQEKTKEKISRLSEMIKTKKEAVKNKK